MSIVIPTYNRGSVLPRTIESALAQTFSDFELIVVDDGSTDHTTQVVRGIADPRIRLVGDTTNRGPSAARNQGIREARSGLVAFLDSDDEWLPRKLELQLARLHGASNPKTAVAYCRVHTYDDVTKQPVHEFGEPREGELFLELLAGWHPVTTSLFLVRRAALLEVGGFDETLLCGEDYDLWLRLAQASYRFVAVNEVLVIKHENTGVQLSKDPAAKLSGHERMDHKWRATIIRHLGRRAYRRWRVRRGVFLMQVYFVRVRDAASSGRRAAAWRWFLAMLKLLTLSRAYLLRAFVAAILGPRAHRAVAQIMSPSWVSPWRSPRVKDAISKMRRAPRRALWETEFAILRVSLAGRRAKPISAMLRVKDEEEFLYPAVKSIAAHVDEIVIVDNLSSDHTPAIIAALRREYPGKVIAHEYPYRLLRRGSENRDFAERPEARSSPNLSATYYNACLRLCRGPFVLKWDGDMIATDRFGEALEEWRASTKLVMRFKGANVHPDREHLVAARSSDLEALASGIAVPFLPEWIASMSHAPAEPRLFPKRFAQYQMGRWTQTLRSPCLHARSGLESRYEVSEPCFLHLKFCKRAPYSDYSPDLERVVSSNVTLGPALTLEGQRTLRRWGLGRPGSDPQT